MTLDSKALGFAGFVILVSAMLAHFGQPAWLWLTEVLCGEPDSGQRHRVLPGCDDVPGNRRPPRHDLSLSPIASPFTAEGIDPRTRTGRT